MLGSFIPTTRAILLAFVHGPSAIIWGDGHGEIFATDSSGAAQHRHTGATSVWTAWETFSVEQMYVGLFMIAIIGFVLSVLLNEIERIVIPWKRD